MVTDADAQALADRLTVWEGPLPFNLVKEPELLAKWVATTDAGDLYIDSLKDIVGSLSSDEAGSAYNRAIGAVIAAGIEVATNHHQRKANAENRKPSKLEDVYGSTWITSGAGSVVCLWGEPGDPIIELTHLKQPAEDVGPLDLLIDHDGGSITRRERRRLDTPAGRDERRGQREDTAAGIFPAPTKPTSKVRRRLERFVAEEKAVRIEAAEKADRKFADVLYRPVPRQGTVTVRDGQRDGLNHDTQPSHDRHTPVTNRHAPSTVTTPLKEWGIVTA